MCMAAAALRFDCSFYNPVHIKPSHLANNIRIAEGTTFDIKAVPLRVGGPVDGAASSRALRTWSCGDFRVSLYLPSGKQVTR
jgi:hypothetical protein